VFNFISGTGPETLEGAILIALADAALVMWIACWRRLNFFLLIPLRGAGWSSGVGGDRGARSWAWKRPAPTGAIEMPTLACAT
jgi:hypothetical protein